jgi:hypothetical protein
MPKHDAGGQRDDKTEEDAHGQLREASVRTRWGDRAPGSRRRSPCRDISYLSRRGLPSIVVTTF